MVPSELNDTGSLLQPCLGHSGSSGRVIGYDVVPSVGFKQLDASHPVVASVPCFVEVSDTVVAAAIESLSSAVAVAAAATVSGLCLEADVATVLGNSTCPTVVVSSSTVEEFSVLHVTVFGILAVAVGLLTVGGNLVVIASFVLERNIRQPTNYFIASLAVSDLLIGSVSMPFYTVYLLSGKYWPLGEGLCDLWLSLDYTACLCSIYTVFCITADRYCSVKLPARYRKWRTERKVILIVAMTWVIPIAVFFPSIFGWQHFVGKRTVPDGMCFVQYMYDALFNCLLQIGYFWITLTAMIVLYVGIYRVALRLHRRSAAKRERSIACLVSMAGGTVTHIGSVIGMTRQATTSVPPATAAVVGSSANADGGFWPRRKRQSSSDASATPAVTVAAVRETRSKDGPCSPTTGVTFDGRDSVRFGGRLYQPCPSSPDVVDQPSPTLHLGNGNSPTRDSSDKDSERHVVLDDDGRRRRNLRLNSLRAELIRHRDVQHATTGRLSSSAGGSTSTATTTAPNTSSPNPTKVCRFNDGPDTIRLFETDVSESICHPMTSSSAASSSFTASQNPRRQNCRLSSSSNCADDSSTPRSDYETAAKMADEAGWTGNGILEDRSCSVSNRGEDCLLTISKITSQHRRTSGRTINCDRRHTKAATAVIGRPEDLEELPYFDDADDDDVFNTDNDVGGRHPYSCTSGWHPSMCMSDTTVFGQRSMGTADMAYSEDENDYPCDGIGDDAIEMVSAADWQINETDVEPADENAMMEHIASEQTIDETGASCEYDATIRRNCRRSDNLLQPSEPSERRALLPVITSLRPPELNGTHRNVIRHHPARKQHQHHQPPQQHRHQQQQQMRHDNRTRKALRTITIILGAFVCCWIPWHVLSLIIGFVCSDPEVPCLVPPTLYDISYWLCYLNSPINPFCYAFANQQFKKTFLRIMRFDWRRS